MHILFLTPQFPYPPHQGTALRNWGLVSGLGHNHQVSVLSFVGPDQDLPPAPELRDVCVHVEALPGEYGPVEDIHMIIDHLMSNWFICKI